MPWRWPGGGRVFSSGGGQGEVGGSFPLAVAGGRWVGFLKDSLKARVQKGLQGPGLRKCEASQTHPPGFDEKRLNVNP